MNFDNKKVLVVGLARSGLAAIKVLNKFNCDITLSEMKEVTNPEHLEILKACNVKIVNQDMEVFMQDYDLCIKNPGVSPVSEKILKLKERNIPVLTEVELAYQISKPQHYVGITGTNGKTTTTTLVYELMKKAFGDKAHVGGNIGTPLCELVLQHNLMNEEGHYISLELSNAQLVDIIDFKAEVSVIMNMTPDHISFMGGLDKYYKSKTDIYKNCHSNEIFLKNADDKIVEEYCDLYKPECVVKTFSLDETNTDNYIKDGYMYVNGEKVLPVDCVRIPGKHNLQNILVAISAAKALGISNEDIYSVISTFMGVEHRIEFTRELNGVKYYNDSKGTNTDATITALKAFDKNVILLVGGFEKGLDMTEMRNYLAPVKKIIGFGFCGSRLVKDLTDEEGTVFENLAQAVEYAHKIAVSGDIVLLSPTTSSFDQYSCFEERGEHFKRLVNDLK